MRGLTRSRVAVAVAIGAAVFAADQVSKLLVVAHLPDRPPVVLLGGLIRLTLVRNPGAAFSIGTSYTAVFAIIEAAVIIAILRLAARLRSWLWTAALGLLLGGASGNLADRLFRSPGPLRGYVIDWIKLPYFPPWFNLADSSIVIGAALLILANAMGVGIDGSRPQRGSADASNDPEPSKGNGQEAVSRTGSADHQDGGTGSPADGTGGTGGATGSTGVSTDGTDRSTGGLNGAAGTPGGGRSGREPGQIQPGPR